MRQLYSEEHEKLTDLFHSYFGWETDKSKCEQLADLALIVLHETVEEQQPQGCDCCDGCINE